MSESEISSFTSRHSCECYKKLQTYGIPLHISDENNFLSEYPTILIHENSFPLPGFLKINGDITEYLVIEENELSSVFQHMAQVVPKLSDYEENVLSFYILDMLIEGLWTAQNEKMNFDHQKVTLLWILYFFNYIQEQNPSRKDLFDHLKKVLFCKNKIKDGDERSGELEDSKKGESEGSKTSDSNSINQNLNVWDLPLPPDYSKFYVSGLSSSFTSEEIASKIDDQETVIEAVSSSTSDMESKFHQNEINISHMKTILEILYRIFARFWVFMEIQTVFHSMPPLEKVDLPFKLNNPKPLFKIEPPLVKGDKGGKKPNLLEKSSEALEFLESSKYDFILPLQMAEESKLFMKQMFVPQNSQRSAFGKIKEEKNKK